MGEIMAKGKEKQNDQKVRYRRLFTPLLRSKGIDIDNSMTIFVTTCEIQPLAFFDLEEILKRTPMQRNGAAHSSASFGEALHSCYERHYRDQGALEIKYELERQHRSNQELDQSKQELVKFINSGSWRVTAPLRWASDAWHRIVGFKFLAFAEYGVSPCSPQRKENEPVDVMVSFETSRSGSVT